MKWQSGYWQNNLNGLKVKWWKDTNQKIRFKRIRNMGINVLQVEVVEVCQWLLWMQHSIHGHRTGIILLHCLHIYLHLLKHYCAPLLPQPLPTLLSLLLPSLLVDPPWPPHLHVFNHHLKLPLLQPPLTLLPPKLFLMKCMQLELQHTLAA